MLVFPKFVMVILTTPYYTFLWTVKRSMLECLRRRLKRKLPQSLRNQSNVTLAGITHISISVMTLKSAHLSPDELDDVEIKVPRSLCSMSWRE